MSARTGLEGSGLLPRIPAEIFRAYDIRGIYDDQLDERLAELIGRGIGSEALSLGIDTLVMGRDGRLSSPSLGDCLVAGLRASGCNVVDLGVVPTPLVYFATHTTAWTSGIMLTASHNPAAYNGVKMVFRRATLADDQIQQIRKRIERGNFSTGAGGYRALDLKPDYMDYVAGNVRIRRRLKLVIDCANAVPAVIAPQLFRALGCEVAPLYCELDGNFPNHEPDPTIATNLVALQARVREEGADLGLAFDGDGDRLGVVTASGRVLGTDQLLAVLIRHIVPSYPGEPVVFDVKCSSRLATLIRECGGVPVMHRSGHSFMKQKMQSTGAPLGGEFSAHIFIKDRWFGYDDGLYTGARLLEILSGMDGDSDDLLRGLGERLATPELRVTVKESMKFDLMAKIIARASFPDGHVILIDGIRVDFDHGWGLLRASNTSPALLLRFEADTPSLMADIQSRFRDLLRQADPSLQIPF